MSRLYNETRPAKRRRLSEDGDTANDQDEDSRQAMLEMLEAQCSVQLGVQPVLSSVDDDDNRSWDGIESSEDEAGQDEVVEGEGPDERSAVEVISYAEDIWQNDENLRDSKRNYKAFMAPSISKQVTSPNDSSQAKKNSRKNAAQDVDEDSQEMRNLDATLQNLIATLPTDTFATHGKTPNYTIQKNTPLPLRKALSNARLSRAKKQAEADRQGGVVRSRPVIDRDNAPALNKKDKRAKSGEEDRRRRTATGLGGAIGTLQGKGASVLRLSRDEIARGARGLVGEARKKGSGTYKKRKPTKSK